MCAEAAMLRQNIGHLLPFFPYILELRKKLQLSLQSIIFEAHICNNSLSNAQEEAFFDPKLPNEVCHTYSASVSGDFDVCLFQKDTEQCGYATKFDCTHCGKCLILLIVLVCWPAQ